jgi:hypothetical protein
MIAIFFMRVVVGSVERLSLFASCKAKPRGAAGLVVFARLPGGKRHTRAVPDQGCDNRGEFAKYFLILLNIAVTLCVLNQYVM